MPDDDQTHWRQRRDPPDRGEWIGKTDQRLKEGDERMSRIEREHKADIRRLEQTTRDAILNRKRTTDEQTKEINKIKERQWFIAGVLAAMVFAAPFIENALTGG